MLKIAAIGVLTLAAASAAALSGATPESPLIIDYPLAGSVFPPDFAAPTFVWRDGNARANAWGIEVSFTNGAPGLRLSSRGQRMQLGEIDPRCIASTNQPPQLTAQQAASRVWTPDAATWASMKQQSRDAAMTVTIIGYPGDGASAAVSRGQVTLHTANDPVGAPIFYRDVPLMPSETEKGVIKPLATSAVPLIAWRVRDVAERKSRIVMEGIHSCANCHSASADGRTMGMDLDGPQNDKGLYALFPVRTHSTIRSEDVVAWSTYRGKLGGKLRVGFMSQVSPDGRHVVTTISEPAEDQSDYQRRREPRDLVQNYYVANFRDYRFLQVFYPTRGILAWYDRASGKLQPLPGADDPRYVHTNAVWSPDGTYVVFARAEAREPYPPAGQPAEHANDPNETQIQYDLYRIPFNGGRGGEAQRIEGASRNGMSNSFPKVSPDGKWIVFVQARNGQLMRPDSELFIVPAGGGTARRLHCNTALMNSWHSFSPNGRWLVFSSKSLSPYTQMFLTHIDEEGNDSPAILIENSTAANRAVNIPEFLNIAPGGLEKIDAAAAELYRVMDRAAELAKSGQHGAAVAEWRKALELGPADAAVHFNLANALGEEGSTEAAISHYEKAIELSPEHAEAHNNLGNLLASKGRIDEAIPHFEKAVAANPANANAHSNLGIALAQRGRLDEAVSHFERALAGNPEQPEIRINLAVALMTTGKWDAALPQLEKAVQLRPDSVDAHFLLGRLLAARSRLAEAIPHLEEAMKLAGGGQPDSFDLLAECYARSGRVDEAIEAAGRGVAIATSQGKQQLVEALRSRISEYQALRRKAADASR